MPAKNTVKSYAPESYYHIYTRGVNKQITFDGEEDFRVFIGLFKRYLSKAAVQSGEGAQPKSKNGHIHPSYATRLELISFALMPNHIHLFVYQHDERAIIDFMRSLLTSYCMQYNKIHKRVGPLFQSRYRAVLIQDDSYLQHISRYIHLNPHDWEQSDKTSLDFFTGKRCAEWIHPEHVLARFRSKAEYLDFVRDYEDTKNTLSDLKWELVHVDDDTPGQQGLTL